MRKTVRTAHRAPRFPSFATRIVSDGTFFGCEGALCPITPVDNPSQFFLTWENAVRDSENTRLCGREEGTARLDNHRDPVLASITRQGWEEWGIFGPANRQRAAIPAHLEWEDLGDCLSRST